MSENITALIQSLARLLKLHRSFLEAAEQKTGIVKRGDVEALRTLLKQEQELIVNIQMEEQQRLQIIAEIFPADPQKSLTQIIAEASGKEKIQLKSLQQALVEDARKLKEQNELNQQLIKQSLDFVNLSIDALRPQPVQAGYERPNKQSGQTRQQSNRSIFDSKA